MMKFLRFFLLTMVAMLAGTAVAQTVTIDFDADYQTLFPTITGVSSGTGSSYVKDGEFNATTTSEAVDGITVTVTASATDATTRNRIWSSNPRLRMYDGAITFTSADKNIQEMVMTIDTNSSMVAKGNTADSGVLTEPDKQKNAEVTWTGSAKSVTITLAGNTQFHKVVLTLDDGQGQSKTATTISFADDYAIRCTPGKDETVALPVATVKAGDNVVEGATVTWTSNNEEIAPIVDGVIKPVNGNQGSVTITASYAGNDTYRASSKSYTLNLYKGYVAFAELVKDLNSTNEKWDKGGELASFWMGEMVNNEFKSVETLVTFASGSYIYLTDGTNHLLFYGSASVFGNSEQKLKAGDKITMDYGHEQGFDAIWGTAYRYKKLPEFKVEQMVVRVASENNEVAYTTITADQIVNYINAPVKIENAQLDSINAKNIYFHVGDIKLNVYNQFGVEAESLEIGATYTLSGMGCVYNDNYQIYLVDFVKTGESASVTDLKVQNRFNGAIYNLRGQRITTPAKGLYIMNGKKYFVK